MVPHLRRIQRNWKKFRKGQSKWSKDWLQATSLNRDHEDEYVWPWENIIEEAVWWHSLNSWKLSYWRNSRFSSRSECRRQNNEVKLHIHIECWGKKLNSKTNSTMESNTHIVSNLFFIESVQKSLDINLFRIL